jgi:hypothetical protein
LVWGLLAGRFERRVTYDGILVGPVAIRVAELVPPQEILTEKTMRKPRLGSRLLLAVAPCLTLLFAASAANVGVAAARTWNGPTARMIVVLRAQNRSIPARSAFRHEVVRDQQAPLIAQMRASGGKVIATTTLVNAVIARMSAREARILRSNPSVAEVIPDGIIHGPRLPVLQPSLPPASFYAKRAAFTPGPCGTGKKPELDPEALANVHATQAQALGFTGAGVKVAYLADGVDPNNVDFKRNAAYASKGSAAGSPVVTQHDYSGDGTNAPTAGGEAFGDASSIGAQGNAKYDLSTFVSAAHPLPAVCDIRIVGAAPGSSIVALKVFGQNNDTTESGFIQAINDAVVKYGVKVINESFGMNSMPDTVQDTTRVADDAAVAAGVTVVVSSGDAGITSTIGSPATDPNMISVGASTTFRGYEQETFGGVNDPKTSGKYVDNNISSLSSGGFAQNGRTVDLVAPGDLNWALCSTNVKLFADCTSERGTGAPIELFGGTSESSPLTAGAAADVIQAYAKTHHGATPAPALVKRILMSTATDIGAPATEQGAGLLNVAAAVKLAESVTGAPTAKKGDGLLISPNQINVVTKPGATSKETISLTNTGAGSVKVSLGTRALTKTVGQQSGQFCMQPDTPTKTCPANTGVFPIWSGAKEVYQEEHFKVPSTAGHLSRLVFSADYPNTNQTSLLHFALLEPNGAYAAYSLPQGLGDYGEVEVANPPAGSWTAVFFTVQNGEAPGAIGTSGKIQWNASTLEYGPASRISPSSITIAPGKTAKAHLSLTTPNNAGDTSESVAVGSSLGITSVPVTIRSMVPTTAAGGSFSGVLTGGNGRGGAPAQTNTYDFSVPSGAPALDVGISLANDPSDVVIADLVDPNGQTVGYSSNLTTDNFFSPVSTTFANLYHANPMPGVWRLVLAWQNPVSGAELREPFTGGISFSPVTIGGALPNRATTTLKRGTPYTFRVTVENDGAAPQAYFADPRLQTSQTLDLPDQNSANKSGGSNLSLPLPPGITFPYYLVPTDTSQIKAGITGNVPVTFDIEYFPGDPDLSPSVPMPGVKGAVGLHSAGLTFSEPEITPGVWLLNPDEIGPYPATGAPKATASVSFKAVTQAFDPAVASSTGDLWSAANGLTSGLGPDYVPSGDTGNITVQITPTAAKGTVVSGRLYLDDVTLAGFYASPYPVLPSGDQLGYIPYKYKVG